MKSTFRTTLAIALGSSMGIAQVAMVEVKGTADLGISKPVTSRNSKAYVYV